MENIDTLMQIDKELKIIKDLNPTYTATQKMLKWYENKGAIKFIDFAKGSFKVVYGIYQQADNLYREWGKWKAYLRHAEQQKLKQLDDLRENGPLATTKMMGTFEGN